MSVVAPFIGRMRARQAALFDTTVTVTTTGTAGTLDDTTGARSAPNMVAVYSGPALVRPQRSRLDEVGETAVVLDVYTVKLPVDTLVEVGDVVTVTASTHDAVMVGLVLRVSAVVDDEWQIARVCSAVRQTGTP